MRAYLRVFSDDLQLLTREPAKITFNIHRTILEEVTVLIFYPRQRRRRRPLKSPSRFVNNYGILYGFIFSHRTYARSRYYNDI